MNDKLVRHKIYNKEIGKERDQKVIVEIMKEWNVLVLSFASAKESWEKIRDLIIKLSSLDLLTSNLQRKIYRVCVTTQFHYAVKSFFDLLGFRDNITDFLISDKKKEIS